MFGSLTPRSVATFAALLAAYVASGLVAAALLHPSHVWFLVLGADFLLVTFCTLLARIAADKKDREASIESLGIGIGTVAPLGTHGLQFALQVLGDQAHAASDSVVGAAIHGHWPAQADAIYLVVLSVTSVLCAVVAAIAALHARQSQQHATSLGISILLLVGSTLFLLPWFGTAAPNSAPPSLSSALVALAVIATLLWGSNLLLRSLLAAVRLAGRAAATLLQVAFGAAIVGAAVLVFYGVVLSLIHVAGPLVDMLRLAASALAWFVGVLLLLGVVVVTAGWVAGILRYAAGRFARLSRRSRFLAVSACAVVGVMILLVSGRGGAPSPPPLPAPARVVFEEAPLACAGFRWEYGETDRISAAAANCLVYSDASILVAVGSATPQGGPDTEPERALQRGRALANAIVSHLDTARRNPRVMVLNRGMETPPVADDARIGPHLAVLAGTVAPRGAQVDDVILQRDLGDYLRGHADGSRYSHCDLYPGAGASQPLRLNCGHGVDGD